MESKKVFPDDASLTHKISLGDVRAFAILYEKHHRYIYHFSLNFLKTSELAEEVVQDVLLKIWDNRHTLDPARSLKGYITIICKNHVLNLMKQSLREKQGFQELAATMPESHSETEDGILMQDYEHVAEMGITQLPPQRQKVFRMYRIEGASLNQIAESMGISVGTVKDHLLKANHFLRNFLQHYVGLVLVLIRFFRPD